MANRRLHRPLSFTHLLTLPPIYVGLQHQIGPGPFGFRSTDVGQTWAIAPYAGVMVGQTSEGTSMAFEKLTYRKAPGEFVAKVRFSTDDWKTVDGPREIPLHIPNATGGAGDDLNPFEGPLFWRSVVELPSGDVLATMYGHFEGDDVPIELPRDSAHFNTPGFNKYRSLVIRSRDQGRSWSYLSTIAYAPSVGPEGFAEPAMVRLPDGRLLSIMRTGSIRAPMYASWSSNGGETWSTPVSTGVVGVDPDLIVMQNGVVVCGYGVKSPRRERRVVFSLDHGKSWVHDTLISSGPGGTYPGLREIRSGVILFVYDAQAARPDRHAPRPSKFHIMGSFIEVRKAF